VHRAFDELRRLGLDEATETRIRGLFPDQTGMLVVDEIIQGGSADGRLSVGDILLTVEGEYLTDFVPLEAVLDDRPGGKVAIGLQRNGKRLDVDVPVMDLHAITPDEYIGFGDAVLHDLSYQQARNSNRPVEGVYVANPGYVLSAAAIPRGAVIVAVGDRKVRHLDDLEEALAGIADQEQAAYRYYSFDNPVTSKLRVVRMDRRWFPAQRCRRNDATGLWPCRMLAEGPAAEPLSPASARFPRHRDRRVRAVMPSLVLVNFDMPYTISGVSDRHYYGTGLVVDAQRGLVVVDRNTVPEAMGDVRITFAGAIEVPARVQYIHPKHNLAVVAYDPALIGDTPVRAARLGKRVPAPGDSLWVVGLKSDSEPAYQSVKVASVNPIYLPLSRTIRFREANLETVKLVNGPEDLDGVIIDGRGRVLALWSSFAYQGSGGLVQENRGVPTDLVREILDLARDNRSLHSLEVEWRRIPISSARKLGLTQEWLRRLEAHDTDSRQVLSVVRTVAGTPAAAALQPGDLLLSVDGATVTRFREVERAVADRTEVELEVLRNERPLKLRVETVALDGDGVRRAVMWAGALLQAPYRDMAAQRGVEAYGVYVAYFAYGSPASRFGLFAGRRITEVDGQPVPDLDRFLELVRGRPDRDALRLTTVTWNNVVEVLTLKLDQTYWPAYEIYYGEDGWSRAWVD